MFKNEGTLALNNYTKYLDKALDLNIYSFYKNKNFAIQGQHLDELAQHTDARIYAKLLQNSSTSIKNDVKILNGMFDDNGISMDGTMQSLILNFVFPSTPFGESGSGKIYNVGDISGMYPHHIFDKYVNELFKF